MYDEIMDSNAYKKLPKLTVEVNKLTGDFCDLQQNSYASLSLLSQRKTNRRG